MKKILSKIDSRHKAGVWVDDDQMRSATYKSCLYWHDMLQDTLQKMAKKDTVYDFDSREISEVIKVRERFDLFQCMLIDGIKDSIQHASYIRNQRTRIFTEAKPHYDQIIEQLSFIFEHMNKDASDSDDVHFRRRFLSETINELITLSMLLQKIESLEFLDESRA